MRMQHTRVVTTKPLRRTRPITVTI
ncbi:hypothetical protein PIIN_11483 [Serendipita indica DSM 11827]|uniref:Uncharacterized protein n=1 Tax=Serendipita indica (strain DSM 11827) TaxID=1109443 RepID=G4U1R3_SERID|nr:hypothetical protein PIIN_11483 [Serendipita indica DSM 11827]